MENIKEYSRQEPTWGMFNFIAESIRNKLLVALMALSLIPLIILGIFMYNRSSGVLMEKMFGNLNAVENIKADTIRNHFENRRYDMNVLVQTVETLRNNAFEKLAAMHQLKKKLIESYFTERMNDVSVLSAIPITAEAMIAFQEAEGPVGGDTWKDAERIHGPFLTKFSESYGYYDVFLVSADGRIVYTVAQESDLGQNLMSDELRNGPAGQAFEKGLKSLTFQDFGEYGPTSGAPAAFISSPIIVNEVTAGVIMVQVSVDQINAIMQERTGMGTTGGTYLVGPDKLFRSDSVHVRESTVMNPAFVVDTAGVTEALAGKTGQGVVIDYRGEYVLSSWTPVNIHGVTYAMLAEIDVTEAFVPGGGGDEKDFFTKYKEGYGYYDLCLINPDGYLFYSVERGKDYQTNILSGPYKDSNLGRLAASVLETKAFGMADFEKYLPNDNSPAAFFAQPVVREGKVELIVAAKLSLNQINAIMQDHTGLGDSGETYLIGPDKLWRSDSRFLKELRVESTVLNPGTTVDTAASRSALAGEKGTQVVTDYRGRKVLSSWSPLVLTKPDATNPQGIRWALVADIEYEEVHRPVVNMAWFSAGTIIVAAILVVIVSLFLTRGLTTQVNHIMDLFGEIGRGKFEARTPVTSQDELGTLAFSLNAMLDNTLSLIRSSDK